MDIENQPEKVTDAGAKHPTPEQLFLREAIKHLTLKQKAVWDLHSLDKLTQAQIGKKLGISQQAVDDHISASEARIAKWCKNNMAAYNMLKRELGPNEVGELPNGAREAYGSGHKTPARHNTAGGKK